MNLLNPLAAFIMKDFALNAHQLSNMSSLYFYGNFLMVFPAGILLDNFSIKKLLICAMILAIFSIFLFGLADHLSILYVSRFVCGISASFAFLGAAKLATR